MTLVAGCGDQEEKANKIYNKAAALERAGGFGEAEPFYNEVVEKYPSTQAAGKVREKLASKKKVNETVE